MGISFLTQQFGLLLVTAASLLFGKVTAWYAGRMASRLLSVS